MRGEDDILGRGRGGGGEDDSGENDGMRREGRNGWMTEWREDDGMEGE
jgi:hypothetical protein